MKPGSMKYYDRFYQFVSIFFSACTCSAQVITLPYELWPMGYEQTLQKTCLRRSICGVVLCFACVLQQNESPPIVPALKPGVGMKSYTESKPRKSSRTAVM